MLEGYRATYVYVLYKWIGQHFRCLTHWHFVSLVLLFSAFAQVSPCLGTLAPLLIL